MKPAAKCILTLLALPAVAFVLDGCAGVAVSGEGYTPVYGNYGYVGPWDTGGVDVEGGIFVAPPYGRPDRDHRDEDNRREHAAPERSRAPEHTAPVQHAAPVQRAAPRPIPSVPNNPRPARQGGGNDKSRR